MLLLSWAVLHYGALIPRVVPLNIHPSIYQSVWVRVTIVASVDLRPSLQSLQSIQEDFMLLTIHVENATHTSLNHSEEEETQ
jgi:hypothetical protein